MCGIAGFVRRRGPPDASAVLDRMLARMIHRGPDDSGAWISTHGDWEIALGHRRLSIIDLKSGHQPMGNEDGSVQVTFNGEIYNFEELRQRLEKQGHRFATRTDTEVIVHLHEQEGESAVSELNGMFAFALWNRNTGKLLLARDRAGVKPLYFMSLADDGIAFASELTALLQFPAGPLKFSRDAMSAYFFCDYVPHPLTPFEGIRKLEPGCLIAWDPSKTDPASRPFWSLASVRSAVGGHDDKVQEGELVEKLRETMARAVRRQLVSDVPLGIFLSGGIDSSLVAALAQKSVGQPVRTFSITFSDPTFDEGSYARQVARHIGSEHTEEALGEEVLIDTIGAALAKLDEPLADPSLIPTYLLARLASQHVKVALGGDGGDELWGGYPTYRAYRYGRIYAAIPQFMRESLLRPLISALPIDDRYQSFEWKAKRFAERWDPDAFRRHARWMSSTDLPDLALAVPGSNWDPARQLETSTGPDELNAMLALDFQSYLPGSVLTKVDRATMAHSLEARPPFLDNEMIDFAFSLPSRLKVCGDTTKYLLKLAARSLLPDEIIDRPKKGFGIPLGRWMKGPMRPMLDAVLRDSPLWETRNGQRALNRDTFVLWNEEHQDRRKDRSKPLWALTVLDHWMRKENLHVSF